MQITHRIALTALVLAALVMAPLADAKSPPKKKYQCTISGLIYGDLFITGKSSYKFGLDGKYKKGTYTAKGKVKSGTYKGQSKIRFKTGRLKKHKGRWFKSTAGQYEIALAPPGRTFENIACDSR